MTDRFPPPKKLLGQMIDVHIKPISFSLDPFLIKHATELLLGGSDLRNYQKQALLANFIDPSLASEFGLNFRFATRMQMEGQQQTQRKFLFGAMDFLKKHIP